MAMIFRLCHDRVKSVTKGYEALPKQKITTTRLTGGLL